MHGPDPSWCARLHARPGSPPDPAPLPIGSPYRRREIPEAHECEPCGAPMYDHNCKIVCPNCGYKRDCSDP